jgi:glycosyltransferase involved in cell wall biosynthesis
MVSVIIPTFDSAEYIPAAIESVLFQTYSNIEIIVINDGSTDNTKDILRPYLNKIVYLEQKNTGPAAARNLGIDKAHGDFIGFLDADDVWMPSKLEKQLRSLQQDPKAGLVYSKFVDFHHRSRKELGVYPREMHSGILFDLLLTTPLLLLSSVIIRTRVLKELGGFDEGLTTAEDTHLYLRIARNYRIIGVPEILVRRRIHDRNLSNRVDVDIGTLSCLDRIVRLFPETDPRIYRTMAIAYQNRGKAMMLDCFHSDAYAACNRTARRLLRLRIWDSSIMFYFLLTLFPGPLISFGRSIRKRQSNV